VGLAYTRSKKELGVFMSTLFIRFAIYYSIAILNPRWVKHNTNFSANGLWGEVPVESAPNNAISSVCTADLSPVDAELGSVLSRSGSLGNEGNTLSEVKLCLLLRINTLDLDQ
jgi:hypothetical protein